MKGRSDAYRTSIQRIPCGATAGRDRTEDLLGIENGKIAEEICLDEGLTSPQQLGLIRAA
jgi:hypothetical protein